MTFSRTDPFLGQQCDRLLLVGLGHDVWRSPDREVDADAAHHPDASPNPDG
jgi:hypothetical protein